MNHHLSEDQFDKCLLAGGGPSELAHLRECPECRAEVEGFSKGLALFRKAVRDLAGDPVGIERADFAAAATASSDVLRWHWAIAAATLVAAIMLPFFISRPTPIVNTPAGMSPEAVMERLNRHLTGTLPEAMEPVMSLISAEEPASEPGRAQ